MKTCYCVFMLCFFPLFLFPNGGPIDESTIKKVGDLKFINMPYIKIINEDLVIRIDGDYAEVKVAYTLQGGEFRDENIFYAFPIDFGFASIYETHDWNDNNVSFINFKKNGKLLQQESQIDLQTSEDNTRRKWYFVKFEMKKNEEVKLEVHYKFKVGFVDIAYSKSFYPVFNERTFIYDFSAAQYWGGRKTTGVNISLDVSGLKMLHGKVLKVNGINFEEENGHYTFQITDFNFKEAPNLEVQYELKTHKSSAYILKKLPKREQIKKIITSSLLEQKYSKDNLVDVDFSTCWCAKTKDKSPKLTFTFKDSVEVSSIVFTTGYLKSKETYYNNNRLKKVAITQHYTSYDTIKRNFTYKLDLEDIPYQEINTNTFYDMVKYTDSGDMFMYTSKIEIDILETYKGEKYNDTCISEILFPGYKPFTD
ncbi:discoidin domain-containing protein [Hyunsoonleella ulvae]|uniref:discoidin domain-containing protein n=1 Tax=Hyunsoonleella ulvae TaxID=2799948 RepID=UPI001939F65B|nr:hypothetical protein [Hyunsoonleella ulvae]